MNSIAKSFKRTAVIAIIMLFGLVATMTPLSASAQMTQAEFQAEIARLTALIEQLTLQLSGGAMSSSTACPYTWTRSLTTGSTGSDVMKLQQFLNSSADTQLAVSGAGSAGNETQYFGPITAAAVTKFQNKYRADVLTPLGLAAGTGYFGPSTMAKANALCASTPVTPPADNTTDDDESQKPVLRGEGTIGTFEIDNADDTDIEENAQDQTIAEITLEADDGDIELNRIDIALVGINTPTESDPWDVFEDIAIWIDGDLVKRMNADDKDDYLNKNDGTLRFSKLDFLLEEREEAGMLITASTQNNVDGAGIDADWSVSVESIRYFDGDGVATTDTSSDEIGDTASFSIVEEGDGEELKFSLSSNNPGESDIIVDDTRKTNDVTILRYTIKAEDNDIDLDRLFVTVVTSATTSQVVDDITIEIDGDSFKDDDKTVNSAFSTTYEFDIDGDITIDEDDEVEVEVIVDLKARLGRYDNGTTIKALVTSTERDATEAEGADDITTFSGTAVGKTHTLLSEGIVIPRASVETDVDRSGSNDTIGEYRIEFEVTAVENDFYITADASRDASTATTGVAYTITGPSGFVPASSSISAILTSGADENTPDVFTVREGDTETFTLIVTINPNVAGQYRVGLTEVNYDDDSSGSASTEAYIPVPTQDYRTMYRYINN